MPIELSNASYTYAPKTPYTVDALKNISLSVNDGEFVGVMGHTGCGKSTLIQLLAGLLAPTSGQVLLDGEDINSRSYDRDRLRRRVGVVFQFPEYQLFETTVERDVAFGLRHSGLKRDEVTERVRNALATVGFDYEKIHGSSPLEFSGGEKRRIAIAGVLATEPGILILDEPVAGLDPLGRQSFLAMLDGLNGKGVTVIMISHNTDALAEHAERLILMKDGEIILDGPTAAVLSHREAAASCGVGLSQPGEIASMLRLRGMDIPSETVKYSELLNALTQRRKGGGL